MKRSRSILLAALLFAAAAAAPAFDGGSPRRQAAAPARDPVAAQVVKELAASLPGWIKEKDVPGVAVAVVDDKEILWRCREHLSGLFFTYDGEALDFRGTAATFRNIALIRTRR